MNTVFLFSFGNTILLHFKNFSVILNFQFEFPSAISFRAKYFVLIEYMRKLYFKVILIHTLFL